MPHTIHLYYTLFALFPVISCYTSASDNAQNNPIGVVNALSVWRNILNSRETGWVRPIGVTLTPNGTGKFETFGIDDESTQAAYTYIKANARALGIEQDILENTDIYVYDHHSKGTNIFFNVGVMKLAMNTVSLWNNAVSRLDSVQALAFSLLTLFAFKRVNCSTMLVGPSAGITTATAILSALTQRSVDSTYAMTGEIDPQGNIIAIDSLKEKILAAKEHGLKNIIIPADNIPDLFEIHPESLEGINIIPVRTAKEVFAPAL